MPRQDGHTQDNCPTSAPDNWATAVAAHKDRTRARILTAAAGLLAERGAGGLAMTMLARRAGVARATLYNYFPDAGQVLEALVRTEVAAFLADLDRQLETVTGPATRLETAVTGLLAWVADQAARRPVRDREADGTRPADVATIHRPLAAIEARIAQVITAARDAGALPAGTEPALAARFTVALTFSVRGQLDGHVTAALRDFLLAGLRVHSAADCPAPAARA